MPGSTISSGQSSHSSGSRRGKTRQYHVVSHTSQVDESLFGTPTREVQRQQILDDKRRNSSGETDVLIEKQAAERSNRRRSGGSKPKRETVQVVTKDLIRNLVVPEEDPSGYSTILSQAEFERIRVAARVLSEEERNAAMEKAKRDKEGDQDAVQDRKNYMKMKDLQRRKNEKLSDLEEEKRVEAEHLRQHAIAQLQEQEDEIKHLNELILNAKCRAIRDAQILEKDFVSEEMTEEEKRLDHMMELDRVNAIHMDENIERKRQEERLLGAMKIMEQIQENEQERLLDLERKDQENRMMQKYLNKLCEEESEKLDKRRQEQQHLRHELNKCNADIIHRKESDKEQEKMIDQKVLEFQRAKAERESAFEKEQERQRIEKEKEVSRLRALQERARDEQSERDALRAKRAQEQAEREWRQKEADESRLKADTEAMLKEARYQQMEQKEHFLAVQAQRERADFERVLKAQKELAEKEKREEEERRKKGLQFSEDVREQIRNRERIRIEDRNAFFEEGVKLDEEARARRQRLDEVKRKKLEELRAAGIHDKYLAQIERKINQPQHVTG